MTETKEDFGVALWKLLETNDIDDISVSDIVKVSGRSHASFYRFYKDKYDLSWELFHNLLAPMSVPRNYRYTIKGQIGLFLEIAIENRAQFTHALSSLDPRATRRQLIDVITEIVSQSLELSSKNTKNSCAPHAARIYANSMVVMLADWLSGNVKLTVDEMQKAYCHWISLLTNVRFEKIQQTYPIDNEINLLICLTTLELLTEKRMDDLRTSEIIRRSGVSRSVFYKNFEDKYDVVGQYFVHRANNHFRPTHNEEESPIVNRDTISSFLEELSEHRIAFRNAFESQDRCSLRPVAIQYFTKLLTADAEARGFTDTERVKPVIRMFVLGAVGHVGFWLLKPQQSVDEVVDTFEVLYRSMFLFEPDE